MAGSSVCLYLLGSLGLFLSQTSATQQSSGEGWCSTGIRQPDLADDYDVPSVDILVAQAPLFSRNPKIGKKLGLLHLFHTAIVLVQRPKQSDAPVRNWTLEFDSVTDVMGAVLPKILNDSIIWDNDARYCLTEGILWGEDHWSKIFEVVTTVTAKQAKSLFTNLVLPLNASSHLQKPLYQLFQVKSRTSSDLLVRDITCGDGTNWVLHYLTSVEGAKIAPAFELRFTSIVFNAERIEAANVSDAVEWASILKYYSKLVDLAQKGESIFHQMADFKSTFLPPSFVYDGNSATYFKLLGNQFPWFEVSYVPKSLEGPPWLEPALEVANATTDTGLIVV